MGLLVDRRCPTRLRQYPGANVWGSGLPLNSLNLRRCPSHPDSGARSCAALVWGAGPLVAGIRRGEDLQPSRRRGRRRGARLVSATDAGVPSLAGPSG